MNDTLLKGPNFTNLLVGILCRFRKEPVAFCCEIERIFMIFKYIQPIVISKAFVGGGEGGTAIPGSL